ncbi:substrate-binding domain-containing protein [Streptomyces sp. NPDC057136]|uniref:substrate-binding domain-containing protein n=1 Tax=Streptomyces sp. NPDC057136 TaxID=3346029 RepID=UPI003636EA06
MPPYSARGEEGRGKRHRALIVGVEPYSGDRNDLPAVRRNLRLVAEALTAEGSGVLDPADLVVIPGKGESGAVDPLQVRAALRAARDEVDGLLIVYFAGHGIVRPDGSDLHLLFTSSRVTRDRQHPFMDALSWRDDVMPELSKARADWVVAILDCCFAGNALHSFTPAVGQNFALLTAAEPGVEIPPGDPSAGTEFTVRLHRLLTGRTAAEEPATFTRLVTEIREAMAPLKAVDGHRWIPEERRHGDDVLLAAPGGAGSGLPTGKEKEKGEGEGTGEPEGGVGGAVRAPVVGRRWLRLPLPGLVRRWLLSPRTALVRRQLRSPRRRMTALVLAGAVALTGVGTWLFGDLPGGAPRDCPPAMELRVLTDPDLQATVKKAADAYMERGDGCRSVGITTYDAKATDAVAAFRASSLWQDPPATCPATGDCLRPQRDVGAQPDIWIPAAGSAWRRVMDGGQAEDGGSAAASATGTGTGSEGAVGERVVTLESLGSVAFTPMVLAVPFRTALAPAAQTGTPLGSIISALRDAQQPDRPVSVLRPDPEGTDGALLATEALYASSESGSASSLEQSMVQALRPMPGTARELMCALADGSRNLLEDTAAVLVPEQTMAQFNLPPTHPGRPACATETLEVRVAQYPSDVPVLDLPFLRVTWDDAGRDAEARDKEVTRFYEWLAEAPEAQKFFTQDGFRGVSNGKPAPPDETSPLRAGPNESERAVRPSIPPTTTSTVTATSLSDTLRRYRQALGPGRVLYLLDNSTSMADKRVWDGSGRAKELVTRSMSSLGAGDAYGVWSIASKKDADVVLFGPHGRAAAQKAVAAARTADVDARIVSGLREGFATLRDGPTEDDPPRLLVLVTDDEDSKGITKKQQADLVADAERAPLVRVVVVSLRGGGCSSGRLNEAITKATGGRCLDLSDDIPTELTAEVAKTGTGDAE